MDDIRVVGSAAEIDALPADTTAVKGNDLRDDDLAGLARLPSLRTVYLDGNFELTDRALEILGALPALEELYVSSRHVTDDGLRHLAGARGLVELGLDLLVTGEGFAHLSGLPNLRELHLPGWPNLVPENLALLAPLPAMRKFCFYGVPSMTPAAAAPLCEVFPGVDFEVH